MQILHNSVLLFQKIFTQFEDESERSTSPPRYKSVKKLFELFKSVPLLALFLLVAKTMKY